MTDGETKLHEVVRKLREQAHEAESPYYSRTPVEPDWRYMALAFREIADELEAALAAPVQAEQRNLTEEEASYLDTAVRIGNVHEVQAEVESRSVQRRKALQRGEPMPTFETAPVQVEVGAGERGTIQWWIARCYEAENKLEALLAARPDENVDKRGPAPSETAQKDFQG